MKNWEDRIVEENLLICFDLMIYLGGLDWLPEYTIRNAFRYMWE